MRFSKKTFFILIPLLLVVVFIIFFIFLPKKQNIVVESKTNTFAIKINNTSFETFLNSINVWKENEIIISSLPQATTITQLKIIPTDKASTYLTTYSHFADPEKKTLTLETSFTVEKQIGTIYLYIKPNTINEKNKEYYEGMITTALIKTLYYNRVSDTDIDEYNKLIEKYLSKPEHFFYKIIMYE